MRFLADANIPQSIIKILCQMGFDILDLKAIKYFAKDTEVIMLANKGARIILTLDKDFIALTQYPKYRVPVIVIRLKDQKSVHILEHLVPLLQNQDENILNNSLTIVEEETATSHPY